MVWGQQISGLQVAAGKTGKELQTFSSHAAPDMRVQRMSTLRGFRSGPSLLLPPLTLPHVSSHPWFEISLEENSWFRLLGLPDWEADMIKGTPLL